MATTLQAVATNTAPSYTITAERTDGTIIDLTNNVVTLKLFKGKTQTNVGHEATTNLMPTTAGQFSWMPQTGDLPVNGGTLKGDAYVAYGSGGTEILYNNVIIKTRNPLGS